MFKAHRLLYHSTLGLRVKKKKKHQRVANERLSWSARHGCHVRFVYARGERHTCHGCLCVSRQQCQQKGRVMSAYRLLLEGRGVRGGHGREGRDTPRVERLPRDPQKSNVLECSRIRFRCQQCQQKGRVMSAVSAYRLLLEGRGVLGRNRLEGRDVARVERLQHPHQPLPCA